MEPMSHHHHHELGVRLVFSLPPQKGRVEVSMGSLTQPHGGTGTATLVPDPPGSAFVGTPTIVSSDPSVVAVTDNGAGNATYSVVGTEGQSAVVTGTDTGNGFSDSVTVTVSASPPPAETGVILTLTPNP